jgi:hypothetical protein
MKSLSTNPLREPALITLKGLNDPEHGFAIRQFECFHRGVKHRVSGQQLEPVCTFFSVRGIEALAPFMDALPDAGGVTVRSDAALQDSTGIRNLTCVSDGRDGVRTIRFRVDHTRLTGTLNNPEANARCLRAQLMGTAVKLQEDIVSPALNILSSIQDASVQRTDVKLRHAHDALAGQVADLRARLGQIAEDRRQIAPPSRSAAQPLVLVQTDDPAAHVAARSGITVQMVRDRSDKTWRIQTLTTDDANRKHRFVFVREHKTADVLGPVFGAVLDRHLDSALPPVAVTALPDFAHEEYGFLARGMRLNVVACDRPDQDRSAMIRLRTCRGLPTPLRALCPWVGDTGMLKRIAATSGALFGHIELGLDLVEEALTALAAPDRTLSSSARLEFHAAMLGFQSDLVERCLSNQPLH